MKAKTIRAILSKKHKDFVASIKNEEVRNLVNKNSIVTGGCIVSMLLGEKINDFDYYFTDKETCLKVAEYYVKEFNVHTGKKVYVKCMDDRVKIFVQSSGIAEDEQYQEESTTEFDDAGLEDLNIDELKANKQESDEDKKAYRPIFLSSNAISLTGKVQLVTRFYGDANQIHENYDYVHATCYWTSKDNNLVLPAKALEAILTKELVYTGSKYPLCSIMRAKKFVQRGWTVNAGQFVKMALQLNEMNLLDVATLEEQLTGVDSAYFMAAIGVIKDKTEKDPSFQLDNNYLFTVINRIF